MDRNFYICRDEFGIRFILFDYGLDQCINDPIPHGEVLLFKCISLPNTSFENHII